MKAEGAERSQGAGIMVPRPRAGAEFLVDALLEFADSTTEPLVVVHGPIAVSLMTLLGLEPLRRPLMDLVWQQ